MELGRTAGDEESDVRRCELCVDTNRFADRFDDTAGVEEVDGTSGRRPVRAFGGARPDKRDGTPLAVAGEAAAGLEQANVFPLAAAVVRARVDQTGQQRRPQHGKLLGQRVGDGWRVYGARFTKWGARLLLQEGEGR